MTPAKPGVRRLARRFRGCCLALTLAAAQGPVQAEERAPAQQNEAEDSTPALDARPLTLTPRLHDIVQLFKERGIAAAIVAGCPEAGTAAAKPGCESPDSRVAASLAGRSPFAVALVDCEQPERSCARLLFELRRGGASHSPMTINAWNRESRFVKALPAEPGGVRCVMTVPVQDGIGRDALGAYIDVWIAAAQSALKAFPE